MKPKLTLALAAILSGTAFGSMPAVLPEFKNEKQLAEWRAEMAAKHAANPSKLDVRSSALDVPSAFYTGKPYIESTGSYAFKYRSYNPELARWTSEDPSGFPDGANNRIYVKNLALTAFDYLGLVTRWIEGTYERTATWTEQREFSLNSSFTVSFPWGISVNVDPSSSWQKIGTIDLAKTAGYFPQEATPPAGWHWVNAPNTIIEVASSNADSNPSYGSVYSVFSHTVWMVSYPSNVPYQVNVYDDRRNGSISVRITWKRLAEE